MHELELDAEVDAQLPRMGELLGCRAGLLPVVQQARGAGQEGVHAVHQGETLGRLGDGEGVRETTGLVGEMLRHVRRESGENDLLLGRVAHLEASLGLLARLPLLLRHQATTSPVCPYRLREAP